MKNKWQYGGIYHQYNMKGTLYLPNDSKLKVCDLMKEMPDFMKEADVLFIDPPCSQGNLTTFYTKADSSEWNEFSKFYKFLFQRIDQINPKHLYLEIFASNYDIYLNECKKRFENIVIYNSYYYKNKKNKCWIFHCSNLPIKFNENINNIDEEKVIKYICEEADYNCIGDLCMGTGLVAKYAFLSNKKFVGIELNKKRLAIIVDFINKQTQQSS
jgi:hypothetical protein